LWEPYERRRSRTVLREARGAIPRAYLPVQVDRMPKQYGVNPDFSEPLRSQIFGILNCPPDTDWLR